MHTVDDTWTLAQMWTLHKVETDQASRRVGHHSHPSSVHPLLAAWSRTALHYGHLPVLCEVWAVGPQTPPSGKIQLFSLTYSKNVHKFIQKYQFKFNTNLCSLKYSAKTLDM